MAGQLKKRRKRQVNLDLTDQRYAILLHLAKETNSVSTNGLNIGEVSLGAFIRRISEGEITIVYEEKKIDIPLKLYFGL